MKTMIHLHNKLLANEYVNLIEWIRNGNKFSDTQCETMTVVSVTDEFSVSNSSFDYLCRDKKLGKLCAYVSLRFTSKFQFLLF